MSKSYIIAGAGFRGFCDALALINQGHTVHMVDPAPFLGGLMYSQEFDGFQIDNGVHMFDSIPQDLADIVNEIMEGQTRTIDFVSQSAFNGKVTDGYSLPDLSSLDEEVRQRIESELLALAKAERPDTPPASLGDLFCRNYGETGGVIFCDIFKSVYGIDAHEIEHTAISQTSMGRMKFLDDEAMMKLKQDPWLDTILAARRKVIGKVDDYVSIYPTTGEGMRGWCDRAKAWLEQKGVNLHLGEKILSMEDTEKGVRITTSKQTLEADKLIWSNDNLSALCSILNVQDKTADLVHRTALVFITFVTAADKIKDFTYLQNFDPQDFTYRTAAAGIYSGQTKEDGTSFITCECPTVVGTDFWDTAEDKINEIWDEVRELGIVEQSAELVNANVRKIPVTFKLPRVGYSEVVAAMETEITQTCQNLVLRSAVPFYRREIYLDSLNLNNCVN
ncbi:MAG: NAD(P)-binding protein, partial [Bdellovibrionales bacterium]|nr:NAD(P)-binding protein [Bdellovibrionales bacterium]